MVFKDEEYLYVPIINSILQVSLSYVLRFINPQPFHLTDSQIKFKVILYIILTLM